MISQTGQYALQALIFLADQPPGEYRLAREIGRELGIPEQYLSKILHILARRGILESQKGRNGGFRLGLPASEISLCQILDPLEDMERFYRCLLGPGKCDEKNPCPLHDMWREVRGKYLESLKSTTIDQVARHR